MKPLSAQVPIRVQRSTRAGGLNVSRSIREQPEVLHGAGPRGESPTTEFRPVRGAIFRDSSGKRRRADTGRERGMRGGPGSTRPGRGRT